MKDWREELYSSRSMPKKDHQKPPHLCRCMAAMPGRWIDGVYFCTEKPVYDNMRPAPKK
ncbi:hypothetical protein PAV_1c13390 [Paenibacillus alvei DSM 29]|nr:hypothetical protein PAV_1c13390 [Paenibacillus alvei DSM 29]